MVRELGAVEDLVEADPEPTVDDGSRHAAVRLPAELVLEDLLDEALLGRAEPEKALQETPVSGLRLLPSGSIPPNPAELLGSPGMEKLIEFLESTADLIFFDTPPVLPVTDAPVLAARLDGVLLVVSAGDVSREAVIQAKKALEKVNARILGIILNKAELHGSYAYYQSYYQRGRR